MAVRFLKKRKLPRRRIGTFPGHLLSARRGVAVKTAKSGQGENNSAEENV